VPRWCRGPIHRRDAWTEWWVVGRSTTDLRPTSRSPASSAGLGSNPHPLQEPVAFALRLDVGILREREMHEPALARRERPQKLRPRGALGLFGALQRELLERFPLVSAEALGVQTRVHGLAELLRRDAARQHLEARERLALVGEQRLDVVSDQLEEHLRAGMA